MNYNKLERIALGRGTFGPPTKAHINNGEQVIEQLETKLAYFAARPKPEHKKGVIDIEHRHNMLLRATQGFDNVNALRIGVKQSLKKILSNLAAVHPNAELIVFQGDDVFEYFQKGGGAAMRNLSETGASLAVMPRLKTYEKLEETAERVRAEYGVNIYILQDNDTMKDISSLQVIQRIQDKEYIKEILPPGVPEYIWENNLWNANGLQLETGDDGMEKTPSGIYVSTKRQPIISKPSIIASADQSEIKF